MKKQFLLALFAAFFCFENMGAQEFLATVRVITPQIQQTDRKVFDQLEIGIRDFFNNRKWTNDVFESDERIKLSISLTISEELGTFTFKSELAFQAVRPVFGSSYESPMMTHLDKDFIFSYEPGQPLDFNPDLMIDNLTAVLGFYAYVALGIDYDSFSPLGGESFFQTANLIVTNMPPALASSSPGWRAADGGKNRNRYWIAENFVSPRLKGYRQALYTYHRKGLDAMNTDLEGGKIALVGAMEEIDKANANYFNSMALQMFGNTKRDELIEIFKLATRPQKERLFQIMSKVDPSNAQRYREIGI